MTTYTSYTSPRAAVGSRNKHYTPLTDPVGCDVDLEEEEAKLFHDGLL